MSLPLGVFFTGGRRGCSLILVILMDLFYFGNLVLVGLGWCCQQLQGPGGDGF